MKYIFVWQKTGEYRMPRLGEWYVTNKFGHGYPAPCQYNGKYLVGEFKIIVRRPALKPSIYNDGSIVESDVEL